MRQFNFFYTSYLKNKHGFINMMPHAKLFHPYAGLDGTFGEPLWRTKKSPSYGTDFLNAFKGKTWTYEHKIKMFFPEIRNGVILVSEIGYSADFNVDDKVSVDYKVLKGDNYEEYIEINDFIAEINIEIEVTFGRHGLSFPGSINCNFVDIYLFDQKISIVTHSNNLLFAPYYMPYQTDFPFELSRAETDFGNLTSNVERKYGFIIPLETQELFDDIGINTSKIDTEILNVEMYKDAIRSKFQQGKEDDDEASVLMARKYEKYQVLLPMNIFPQNGYLNAELPIFNSEKCMSCCQYWKQGGGNYLTTRLFDLHSPTVPGAAPDKCPDSGPCPEEYQYETRNKLVNTFLRISDMTWDFLDDRAGVVDIAAKKSAKDVDYESDKYDN